ncbi:MAG: hypothetical protein LBE36_09290 [Flavobacteriaceae bacterium]|jgi:hypothetical protein|nr:hypothetical protein [Flavobacteriaceae bacterium]
MKNFTFLLIIFTMVSCVSTKVSRGNQYDYSRLKPDSEYIIKTKTGEVFRQFKFREETESSIVGIYKKEEMEIEKEDIIKINKFSLVLTTPVAGLVVLATIQMIRLAIAVSNLSGW